MAPAELGWPGGGGTCSTGTHNPGGGALLLVRCAGALSRGRSAVLDLPRPNAARFMSATGAGSSCDETARSAKQTTDGLRRIFGHWGYMIVGPHNDQSELRACRGGLDKSG